MNNIKWETSIKKKNFRYHQQYFTNKSSLRNNIPPVYFLSNQEKKQKIIWTTTNNISFEHKSYLFHTSKKKKIDYFSNSAILGVSSFILEFSLAWLSLKFLVFFTSY